MCLVLCPDEDLKLPYVRLEPNVDLLESANAREYWLRRLDVQLWSSVGGPPSPIALALIFHSCQICVTLVSCSKYILLDK